MRRGQADKVNGACGMDEKSSVIPAQGRKISLLKIAQRIQHILDG